ncbi:MAG: hypothetical protein ACKVWR_02900 [Acidimicrobiales bacterium]
MAANTPYTARALRRLAAFGALLTVAGAGFGQAGAGAGPVLPGSVTHLPSQCPEGSVPTSPTINPELGPCMPGKIMTSQVLASRLLPAVQKVPASS